MKKLLKPQKGIYLISRTSSYNERPCEEAFQMEMMRVDRRSTDDPKKVEWYGGDDKWWYNEGSNHRIMGGLICRDIGYFPEWVIKLKNPMDIVAKYGPCIFSERNGFYEIEIYDDYRE